jgi:predicted component of type VI protein secretion system
MSQTIKLDFEIPQGYYTQEELNNYIKNNISNLLNNSSVDAYSTTKENITIPLKNIISGIDIDID